MNDQNEPSPRAKAFSRFGVTLIVFIAMIVLGLQIGLPLASIRIATPDWRLKQFSSFMDQDVVNAKQSNYWNRRFRFRQFQNPNLRAEFGLTGPLTAAVCRNEIVVMTSDASPSADASRPRDVVHFDLQNGRISRESVSSDVKYILSDGNSLWFLPQFNERTDLRTFVLNGRPAAIIKYEKDPDLFQIVEFADGNWRETSQFALLPGRYSHAFCFSVQNQEHFVVFCAGTNKILYRTSLNLGSEEEAREFDVKYAGQVEPLNDEQLREIDWQQFDIPKFIQIDFQKQSWELIGFRVSNGTPSLLINAKPSRSLVSVTGLRWHSCGDHTKEVSTKLFRPVLDLYSRLNSFIAQGTTSPNGTNYLILQSIIDGSLNFIRLDGESIQQIGQIRSPLAKLICLDSCLFYLITVIVPTILLWSVAIAANRWTGTKTYSFGCDIVELASVSRRGIARSIDLSATLFPMFLSIVCHPDFVVWWSRIHVRVLTASNGQWKSWLEQKQSAYYRRLTELLSPPIIWWLFVLSVLILLLQITWQARSGQTIGKRICDIRVLRKTLRPCGWARSLLREILLTVDGIFFFSWIPGILSMVLTQDSQRLGDRLSDTIVIRETPQSPQVSVSKEFGFASLVN